jgi:hypothetical protein
MNIFSLGNSITVDPDTREVTHIDGVAVAPESYSKEVRADLQAFADQAVEAVADAVQEGKAARAAKAAAATEAVDSQTTVRGGDELEIAKRVFAGPIETGPADI